MVCTGKYNGNRGSRRFEMKWPGSLGIEFTYAGYNKINVKQFYVSFHLKQNV